MLSAPRLGQARELEFARMSARVRNASDDMAGVPGWRGDFICKGSIRTYHGSRQLAARLALRNLTPRDRAMDSGRYGGPANPFFKPREGNCHSVLTESSVVHRRRVLGYGNSVSSTKIRQLMMIHLPFFARDVTAADIMTLKCPHWHYHERYTRQKIDAPHLAINGQVLIASFLARKKIPLGNYAGSLESELPL